MRETADRQLDTPQTRFAMAYRSVFYTLKRNLLSNNLESVPLFSRRRNLSRLLSSGALNTDFLEDHQGSDDLKSRIFRLRLPKRSATNVIQRWVSEGNQVSLSELRQISKELRKSQRFKHALEISEWMVTRGEFELSDSDYAIRIDLMTKVFGIDAAERYFEGLPVSAKTSETCTALLHSYAGAKLVEKAEAFYERIKDSNLSFSALMYNEMMTMYMSVGQVEKVPLFIEELKRKKVAPDIFTYNLWISSCASTLNMNKVEHILDDMSSDHGCNDNGWVRYINLTKIYVTTGRLSNAESNAVVETEKGIMQREWIMYDFLIILHAGLGSKDRVDQIWSSLKRTKTKMTSRNYVCILSSYLMLGHMKEVGEVVDEWKQSTATDFDVSACTRLLKAFEDVGLKEKANELQMLLIQKNCDLASSQSSSVD